MKIIHDLSKNSLFRAWLQTFSVNFDYARKIPLSVLVVRYEYTITAVFVGWLSNDIGLITVDISFSDWISNLVDQLVKYF